MALAIAQDPFLFWIFIIVFAIGPYIYKAENDLKRKVTKRTIPKGFLFYGHERVHF